MRVPVWQSTDVAALVLQRVLIFLEEGTVPGQKLADVVSTRSVGLVDGEEVLETAG